ncbi:hypothetical protein BSE24067_05320 [Burkholderia seminalis]|nr:hypothetical protein BSE24067_05320 [Burkholderia seminalis]
MNAPEELQVKPVALVHWRAVAQLGIGNAVGLALDPVAFANTVLAACAPSDAALMFPQPGAEDAPDEMITCPFDEPAGLSSDTGLKVVPKAMLETSARDAPRSFNDFPIFMVK